MSIPPLVCSTPPPPDQCDDDRGGEDFDIQYNLSQEDEEDSHDYNYGTYSEYTYDSSTSTNIHRDMWSSDISKKTDKLCSDFLEEKKGTLNMFPTCDNSSENKLGFEDTVLEDLNLKLEDQNDEAPLEDSSNKSDTEPFETGCSNDTSQELQVGNNFANSEVDKTYNTEGNDKSALKNKDVQTSEENVSSFFEKLSVEVDTQQSLETIKNHTIVEKISENKIMDEVCSSEAEIKSVETGLKDVLASEKIEREDNFDEFDDFQFIASENNPATTIPYCDNPWNSENSKSSDFGDFTANFDVDNINKLCTEADNPNVNKCNVVREDDMPMSETDDFGDFDDFKSSSNKCDELNSLNNEPSHSVQVLSLNSPDSEVQIIESINSMLSSIFTSEILEPENEFECKIESLLNETWGHLLDTDVRQPYIVNWNNSLGQKSLLKALCIDSRNILFGPKWNNGMPKYAANLTVAPLQPKKPVVLSNTTNGEEQNVDKTTIKETGTWTDPFTSDGKESCNTESAEAKTRSANLDGMTNVMPPEMSHIYSSTLTAQAVRQINLPDTHIFTPTDSETPRSKTIHYDQGRGIMVPQATESTLTDELKPKSTNDVPVNNSENDEEYWEFQDFKASSSNNNDQNAVTSLNQDMNESRPVNNDAMPQMSNNFEPQILQPIKVDPVTPALNWPDPGEVKETFDDFSEFISNAPWSNETINTCSHSNSPMKNNLENGIGTDDDFETFQSAPTFKCTMKTIDDTCQSTTNVNQNDLSKSVTQIKDIPHTTHSNTNDEFIKTKDNLVQNELFLDNVTTLKDYNVKISPALNPDSQNQNLNTIIQPLVPNTNGAQRTQQKTGQILQPLSLESYSQINWPNPGIDLQDLSRFNPLESLQSLKTDVSTGASSKLASPAHKDVNTVRNEISDDDIWGDFVSNKPKQQQMQPKKVFADDDEWTDFVSSPSVTPQNGLNTISLNVHTNLNMQKSSGTNKFHTKKNQLTLDIPTLNYVTPKSSNRGLYNDKHFQNL